MGFVEFIEDHIWVPIVVGIVILAFGILLLVCLIRKCRRNRGYERVPLLEQNDIGLGHRIQRESEKQYTVHRDAAWLNSQFYLRSNPQYSSVQQLEDLEISRNKTYTGKSLSMNIIWDDTIIINKKYRKKWLAPSENESESRRSDKHWFRVFDSRSRSYMLMTMTQKSQKLTFPFTKENRKLVKDMLLLQQHPFILPIADIDFMVDQNIVVVVYPVCVRGSLKDYIYQSRHTDPWKLKYKTRNRGLNATQIKYFGRQILTALIFLEEKGFPSHGHVHSGNIIVEQNKCRLMGCESCLLCEESKLYPMLRKKLKGNKSAFDILCFGHLVFEMCAGYELTKAHPDPGDLYNCRNPSVVEVLNFIFPEDKTAGYPSLQEISDLKFFSEVPLQELAIYNFSPISLSRDMKSLLKSITKGQPMTTRKATLKRSRSSVIPSPKEKEMNLPRGASATQLNTAQVPPTPSSVAPPPPPIAPPAPVPPASPVSPPPSSGGRSALLGAIRKGTSLKKAVTNDRSAPKV